MNTDDPIDWFKLTAYFAGECTAEERDMLEQWLQAAPERRHLLDRLRVLWVARHQRPAVEYGREGVVAHVMTMIQQYQEKDIVRPQTGRPTLKGTRVLGPQPLRWPLWYTLAGFAVAVGFVGAWLGINRGLHTRGPAPISMASYVTGRGQRANITLNDGTSVTLDVASRLEVPADYPTGNHTLQLTGEAMFMVRHHSGRPFTVIAGGITTQVLGTSFVVRHYTTDTTTMVAVRDGKVSVHSLIVAASQQMDIGPGGVARVHTVSPAQFSFATGMLTLEGVPIPEAIVELDRWYDADIRLGDSALVARRVAGEYAAGSLADLAAILEMTFNVRVVRSGRVLTLYQR